MLMFGAKFLKKTTRILDSSFVWSENQRMAAHCGIDALSLCLPEFAPSLPNTLLTDFGRADLRDCL
jgi:hypothetical protein